MITSLVRTHGCKPWNCLGEIWGKWSIRLIQTSVCFVMVVKVLTFDIHCFICSSKHEEDRRWDRMLDYHLCVTNKCLFISIKTSCMSCLLSSPLASAITLYLRHTGIKLRDSKLFPGLSTEKEKWLAFFPKTKRVHSISTPLLVFYKGW